MGTYGREHTSAKREKLAEVISRKCEVTGEQGNMECHHQVPKCFSGPDMKHNYVLLKDTFHSYLHNAINVTGEEEIFYKRLGMAKKLWNNPLSQEAPELKRKISEIDSVLIPKYINNTINKLAYNVRDKVVELTMVSNYHTIRELNMKVHELEAKLAQFSSSIIL